MELITIAGALNGANGYTDATGTDARFSNPMDLAFLSWDTLLIADHNNYAIRALNVDTGEVTTWAGGQSGGVPTGDITKYPHNVYVAGSYVLCTATASGTTPDSHASSLYVFDTSGTLLDEYAAHTYWLGSICRGNYGVYVRGHLSEYRSGWDLWRPDDGYLETVIGDADTCPGYHQPDAPPGWNHDAHVETTQYGVWDAQAFGSPSGMAWLTDGDTLLRLTGTSGSTWGTVTQEDVTWAVDVPNLPYKMPWTHENEPVPTGCGVRCTHFNMSPRTLTRRTATTVANKPWQLTASASWLRGNTALGAVYKSSAGILSSFTAFSDAYFDTGIINRPLLGLAAREDGIAFSSLNMPNWNSSHPHYPDPATGTHNSTPYNTIQWLDIGGTGYWETNYR